MSETALTPELALVLHWHWTQTESPSVPAWVREHPHWPNEGATSWRKASEELRKAALPLIGRLERDLLAQGDRHDG